MSTVQIWNPPASGGPLGSAITNSRCSFNVRMCARNTRACAYNELTTRDYLPNILPHPDTIANGLRLVEPSVMPRNR